MDGIFQFLTHMDFFIVHQNNWSWKWPRIQMGGDEVFVIKSDNDRNPILPTKRKSYNCSSTLLWSSISSKSITGAFEAIVRLRYSSSNELQCALCVLLNCHCWKVLVLDKTGNLRMTQGFSLPLRGVFSIIVQTHSTVIDDFFLISKHFLNIEILKSLWKLSRVEQPGFGVNK